MPRAEAKLVPRTRLAELGRRLRRARRTVVFTNGCFDLIHPGHVALQEEARRHGDVLVVGLNSDRSVRDLKGPARPLIGQRDRLRMLAALECVDPAPPARRPGQGLRLEAWRDRRAR